MSLAPEMPPPPKIERLLLGMRSISKSFPGVHALGGVTLTVAPGEVLALVGENGAGKSTLMRILNGVFAPDAGDIAWDGRPVHIRSPHDAQALGISMIHQELALIPYLDVGKNIYLGREPKGLVPGTVAWARLYTQAREQLDRLGLTIDPRTPVRFLSIAQQQMVEVAKALSLNARLIVMDEPTSSLTDREVTTLFDQIRGLRARGVSVIFITHRLEEVFAIADRVTVLRDGILVASQPISELQPTRLSV
jgi:ribose transport system ATP-binding protein